MTGNSPKICRGRYEGDRSKCLLSPNDFPLTGRILMVRMQDVVADWYVDSLPAGSVAVRVVAAIREMPELA